MNKQINNKSTDTFITRKYFMFPYGIQNAEIFKYSNLLWMLFVNGENGLKAPYSFMV